jgi:anaerobic selenocysteine-containing dehydrogenase
MTRKVEGLNVMEPRERVAINTGDAKALGIAEGDWVQVSSRRGKVKVQAKITDTMPPGVVSMSFHFAECLTNVLTNTALDPLAKMPELKVCAVRVEKISEESKMPVLH